MADRWNSNRREEEEEEDEEDEFNESHYKAQKDALIFAIQVSDLMLQTPPKSEDKKASQDSAALTALKCAYQVMQQRIISNPKDMIAIILFGTKETKATDIKLPDSHCYLLTDLEVPAADDVKALRGLVEEGDDADKILVPSKQPPDMVMLLRLVLHLFQTRAPNFGSRRLFIITDDDDPCAGVTRNPSWDPAVGAKDIYDHGCTIELFPITHGDSKFDTTKFYDDIIYHDPILDETNPGKVAPAKSSDGLDLLNSLVSNINSRQTPKRAYFSGMPLELGPGLTISVKGYNIIQKQAPARSCYIWLDGEKPQVAVGETARLAEDSARTVENFEVKKAYKFGNEYVYFTDEEQKSIKQFGNPCIRIIGFKDRSLLKFWASVKKSIYIFPSEEGYVGSTRVFTALWQKLLKSKKVGVAWHIARKNGNPQLVAVIPSRATSDEKSGTQYMPAGLWLYPIPFVDDVREGPETGQVIRTTDALTDRMNKVVQQLQLPGGAYNPSKYPNPALQWHYKILQALALEDVVPDHPEDATVPKYRAIHKRCGGYIQEWAQVADDVVGQIQEQKKIKREFEADNEEDEPRPVKKARATTTKSKSIGEDGLSNVELRQHYDAGTLAKLTVAELRSAMSSRDLDTKGLKKNLVERLEQWVENNASVVDEMDALGLSSPSRSSVPCRSLDELQGQLHQLLASTTTDTRANHITPSFELVSNAALHLTADSEHSTPDGADTALAVPQQQPIIRTVMVSESVQNQPADDPVLQQTVAKHISNAIGAVDGSSWVVRQVTRGAQGWQFTYICKASLQAWKRANAKNPDRPAIASYSASGGLDPINLSRPAFDCRGSLKISFSKSTRAIIVNYEHTPLHKTVTQLVDRFVPAPIPVRIDNNGAQKTPKAKRPRPADGESSKKRTPKAKPPAADGEEGTRKKRTPKAKRPAPGSQETGEGSSRKRRKTGKAAEASAEGGGDGQNTPQGQTQPNNTDKTGFTGFLNVPPAEAERRRQTAVELLTGKGIDPATLSSEQFNIFANQAPNLQSASLDMLAKYGAERLRIVHPDEKGQAASSSSTPATEQPVNPSTVAMPGPASGSTNTPTKKSRSNKRKSNGPLTEVPIGNGAVVPVEQDGGLGTTASALKPRAPRARKTRGRCDTCKQRSVQCTKEHPRCSTCVDAGVECVYLPPKPRRKSEKSAETVEQEDSDVPEDNDHVQHEAEHTAQVPVPVPQESQNLVIPQPPPDTENDEFIPDPNILSVEHHAAATQSVNTSNYYQHSTHGAVDFRQLPSGQEEPATSGTVSMPDFTYPQAQHSENVTQPISAGSFSSTSVQSHQSHGLPAAQPVSASIPHETQPASSSRKSLPTSQSKQTPVPPPAIPTHGSSWSTSPVMHHSTSASPKPAALSSAKRPKSRKSRAEPDTHGLESLKQAAAQPRQYQSPMTRSPYQSSAQVSTRQGHRSQANTPVATNSRPPPQAPANNTAHQSTTSSASYSTPAASSAISSYDAYPQYNNTRSEQYTDVGNDHSSTRISYESSSYQTNTTTTAPSSYSSLPSYDYGRASGAMNPLSQALNNTSSYSGTASTPANQWPTSQTRGAQNNNSSGYSLPASSTPTHGYSTRASESRTSTSGTSYHQGQAQSYTSYPQASTSGQQNQQNWYGFTAANNNNQANYASNRQTAHSSHRPTATGYSSQYGGNDDQSIYDLLRAGSSNH
ncbi:hypothetical protein F5Y08DRAFT_325903 [Xylaria arbuscula]|nr:hypothetical protein F5Y08DRAFT_325903 [Xylaria arbuscula]